MAQMFNPPHPDEILHDDVLPALELTVTQAAEQLGVARVTLSLGLLQFHLKWHYAWKNGLAWKMVVELISG